MDSSPGAWTILNGEEVKLFGSKLWTGKVPTGDPVTVGDEAGAGIIHDGGLLLSGNDGKRLNVERLHVKGKMIPAHKYGKQDENKKKLELTEDEKAMIPVVREVWSGILKIDIEDDTDFFASGAGSMDVVR